MILCPNCLHKELVGAFFCSECGAQLVFPDGIPTGSIQSSTGAMKRSAQETVDHTSKPFHTGLHSDELIALNIIGSSEILPIRGKNEVTVGRASEGQPIVPDIDLSPYHAYEAGVSRLHISIQINDQEITVTDLGSANGTKINGKQIAPNLPHPLNHGDLLALGRLKIQVLFRRSQVEKIGG